MNLTENSGNDRGMVLFTALMFVLIMSILGTIACIITANDSTIAVNHEVSRKAFYSAEAGVHFGLAAIQKGLKANTMSLPETDGATVSLSSCMLPSDPDITDILFAYLPTGAPVLTRIAVNEYQFTARGYGARNADADIRATFRKRSAFKFGAFGDKGITAPQYSHFYGYDSTVSLTPVGDDGTNQCDIGSNQRVTLFGNTDVHGHIGLGSSEEMTAVYNPTGKPEPRIYGSGIAVRAIGRVEPDPLGIVGGEYAKKLNDSRSVNDNGRIPADLILGNGESVTLTGKSGGANYYFTNIELKAGATLNINTLAGPVNLFMSGELAGKNGTITHAGEDPKKFAIFSDKSDPISLSNSSAFYGVVYAPFADLDIFNGAAIYGAILAKTVEVKNSGNIYFDISLKDKYLTREVVMSTWYEVRR
ncbi:MAG: pilus assembly PilX N-terminal domain-containing protein [Pseudomonadota bacterium]